MAFAMNAYQGLDRDGPLQKRAHFSLQYNAVGRPGEVKFIDTANWMFHPQVEVTSIQWLDMKTLTLQAMPMLADKTHYLCDFYHSIG